MSAAVRCGSTAAWKRHMVAGEKPCDACTKAKAEYDHRWREAPSVKQRNRLSAKAQGMALKALARYHKGEYDELYEAFKTEVFEANGMTYKGRLQ